MSVEKCQSGIALCRAALARPLLDNWTAQIDAQYEKLESSRQRGGPEAAVKAFGPSQRFVPTASSFTIGAVLSDENLLALLAGISAGPPGEWSREEIGGRVACDVDQAWVRRQYAPAHYPAFHAPHGWHQDGALGFDFLSHSDERFLPDALLPMVTCWIALGPCGLEAPGLELVTLRLEGLLAPAELNDEWVRARFGAEQFWRPVMEPGDVLLFRGDILHRTRVIPSMTQDRTSIELRFFPADNLPARLQRDRFVPLG